MSRTFTAHSALGEQLQFCANFISRLLQHEGAYYYFAHQMNSHSLVLGDDIGSHSHLPNGPSTIAYYPSTRAAQVRDEDYIDGWQATEGIASGRFAADDYDFTKPRALLDIQRSTRYKPT